jgi:uncharacterized protein YecT (DUF1311 family)
MARPPVRSYPLSEVRRRKPRPSRLPWILAGVGLTVAIAVGLGAGVYVSSRAALRTPSAASGQQPPAAAAAPRPTLAPRSALRAQPVAAAPPAAASARAIAQTVSVRLPGPGAPSAAPRPKTQAAARTRCAARRDASARLLCGDPDLAALDEELNARYAEAVRSGVPAGPLSDEEQAWVIRRDRLARDAPEELQGLYRDRIAQLTALARQGAKE